MNHIDPDTGDKFLVQDENIHVLIHAGLTLLQAKIYLALIRNGRQTVETLSKTANIDRSNIYREILKLQKIGLVVKKVDTPSIFEALSLDNGIPLLLNYKKEEFEKTKKEAEDLLKKYKKSGLDNLNEIGDSEFILIPKKNAFRKSSIDNIRNAQVSNDTITSLKRLSQALPESFKSHKVALQNGVRTRMIIEKPQNKKSIGKLMWDLMTCPNFELRYTLEPLNVLGVCFDVKTVCILTDPSADIWNSPVLITNHQSFVTLFQNYFNNQWASATSVKKFLDE